MCIGHPRNHPCSHTSITWHYCPSATIDLDTGYEAPCANMTFASAQETGLGCPLQNCQFKDMGGSWTCCACGQGPNAQGWCTMPTTRVVTNPRTFEAETVETTCDHGCCRKCTQFDSSRSTTPDIPYLDLRNGSNGRKSSGSRPGRRTSAHQFSGGFPGDGQTSSSSSSSSSSPSTYRFELDYSSVGKKFKASNKNSHKTKHH